MGSSVTEWLNHKVPPNPESQTLAKKLDWISQGGSANAYETFSHKKDQMQGDIYHHEWLHIKTITTPRQVKGQLHFTFATQWGKRSTDMLKG